MRLEDVPQELRAQIVTDENGCWLWTGGQSGMVTWKGRLHHISRLMYSLWVGRPLRQGELLNQRETCNAFCCNPVHWSARKSASKTTHKLYAPSSRWLCDHCGDEFCIKNHEEVTNVP